MQPTYLPWLGYFSMIRHVDAFVFLDNVQFSQRSWQQRNRIRDESGSKWLTVPTTRPHGRETQISETRVNYEHGFPESHVRALESSYGKAGFAGPMIAGIETVLAERLPLLRDLNTQIVREVCSMLRIDTPLHLGSSLPVTGRKADLLLAISQVMGADEYVSAPGSREYLEEFKGFHEAGIDVTYFEFDHPEYKQVYSPFISHLSVVDALATQGADWVGAHL